MRRASRSGAAGVRIIAALDRRDGIGDVRLQTILFGFASNQLPIQFARLNIVHNLGRRTL
jgi:hypothetical protein